MTTLLKLAERVSTKRVKQAYRSILAGHWKRHADGSWHTREPYPMGLYPEERDRNLYYAIGWGCHEILWPWERWLLFSALSARKDAVQ